ncbi:thioredoxin-disulfide reductase [Thermanaerovibrio acidaminovorans]|uniref:thioredoxin-disulfide reductase n=1 Tax=Thermanaerovibrio acidaminovorans TaxID=81462 RepID=UPI002491773A|nr:thioredoxin-disulfide reductase [Thermanaerovibrio acidaminovorans]
MERRELVILGAGPAGLTAAIYGRRAGLDVLIIERGMPGGQITITDEIENWPGVQHASGQELADSFRRHAEKFSPEFRDATVTSLEVRDGRKVVVTDKGEVEAEAVIIATGANFKRLGCPGEAEYTGRGVSYCAVCDGAFFEGEEVAVIGGGNTAVEEACYLTQFASKVYVVHRRDSFRADKVPVERAMSNPKIVPIFDSVVEAIEGGDMVERLVLRNVKTQEVSTLPVSGVFIFVGTAPNSGFASSLVETSPGGWIKTNSRMETSVEGIFAAGDVRDTFLRQVVTAAGDGAVAAMSAYSYITEQLHLQKILLEPPRVNALFYSSIDQEQVRLVGRVEEWASSKNVQVTLVDGYRNLRMMEKLGVRELPTAMVLKEGREVSRASVTSEEDLGLFLEL